MSDNSWIGILNVTVFTTKLSVRRARANSVDPDQMPQNVASDQGLCCWPIIQQFGVTSTGRKTGLVQILGHVW